MCFRCTQVITLYFLLIMIHFPEDFIFIIADIFYYNNLFFIFLVTNIKNKPVQ